MMMTSLEEWVSVVVAEREEEEVEEVERGFSCDEGSHLFALLAAGTTVNQARDVWGWRTLEDASRK